MGAQNRRALARPARGVSERLDVLAPAAAMGSRRHMAGHVARVSRAARRAGANPLGASVHRRHICVGEKRGSDVGKTKRGKGSKCMVVVDGQGVPLGIHVAPASPAEITLVDATLKTIRVRRGRRHRQPERLIADRAYDSDALRARMAARGITVIVPYRENRTVRRYEDRRQLRRYRHRWIIERTFAWFGGFRRLLIRHERFTSMYCSLLYFAAALIALRRF